MTIPGRLRTGLRPAIWTTAVGALLLGTAGCGIRSTDVPVDAGPAPTVASCTAPEDAGAVELFLICDTRVESVERSVRSSDEQQDPVQLANVLLRELQTAPPHEERAAGFSSEVPSGLRVLRPEDSDPAVLVRLNQHPEDLAAVALAQIICTFANFQSLSDGGGVTLGGPTEDDRRTAWREYTCSSSLRHLPERVPTASPSS